MGPLIRGAISEDSSDFLSTNKKPFGLRMPNSGDQKPYGGFAELNRLVISRDELILSQVELSNKVKSIEKSVENLRYYAIALGIKLNEHLPHIQLQSQEKIKIEDFK